VSKGQSKGSAERFLRTRTARRNLVCPASPDRLPILNGNGCSANCRWSRSATPTWKRWTTSCKASRSSASWS